MLRLIKLCLRHTLGGNSVIFHGEACLLFCVCVVTKSYFWLKYGCGCEGSVISSCVSSFTEN